MYDTVSQYDQVVSGDVDDWHPPLMVRLWQLLRPLAAGTAPMFALQVGFYALGFALVIAALVRDSRWRASIAVAVLALSPLLLGWQVVVLKDGQMLGAMICAFGIVAHFRLQGRSVPMLAGLAAGLLLAYATLVRANAPFATIPLTALLVRHPRAMTLRGFIALLCMLLLLAVEPLINRGVFGAAHTTIAKTEPLFDLAAISAVEPEPVAPFTADERRQFIARHCVKPFFWDPLGDPNLCGTVTARAIELPERELYLDLARAAISHPLAYSGHRLQHWNSTERWLVPPGLISAAPPKNPEPNQEGLQGPKSPLVSPWNEWAAFEAGTPLGWPITSTVIAILLLPLAWRRRGDGHGELALALVVSALGLEASFLVISISSDLRYHLWSMAAAPLALILLAFPWSMGRRRSIAFGALLAMVVVGGLVARAMLPNAPASYQAMLYAKA